MDVDGPTGLVLFARLVPGMACCCAVLGSQSSAQCRNAGLADSHLAGTWQHGYGMVDVLSVMHAAACRRLPGCLLYAPQCGVAAWPTRISLCGSHMQCRHSGSLAWVGASCMVRCEGDGSMHARRVEPVRAAMARLGAWGPPCLSRAMTWTGWGCAAAISWICNV